jgi:glycosyltransferase involved in cell wall biosynthesis
MPFLEVKKLRVLMITLRADYGGGPEHVYRLLKHSLDQVDLFVACPKEEPYWNRYAELVGEHKMIELPHRKLSLRKLIALSSFCIKNKVNILHSHGKGAGFYSRIVGILVNKYVVHTFHGIHYKQYKMWQSKLYLRFEEILSWFTNKFITVSQSEFDLVLELGIVKERNLRLIPNGVEIPIEFQVRPFDMKPKLVINFTRFDYHKNPQLVIKIAEILRQLLPEHLLNLEILLLGQGEENEVKSIKSEIEDKNLGDMIRFGGLQPNPSAWYQRSWCYLTTSRWEGASLALMEAMSYGLPVVASRVVGNIDSVVHHFNGYLFDLDKPELAAQYIATLFTDYSDYSNKSRAARETAKQKFDVVHMVNKTLQLYQEFEVI